MSACNGRPVFKQNRAICLKSIGYLQQQQMKTNWTGVVQLPAELHKASVDGEILVSSTYSNMFLVVFKTWRGKGSNMEGWLFASRPLIEPDVQKNYYGQKTVTVNGVDLVLGDQFDTNWFEVSYRLD
jgi:hypothetical protein